MRQLFCFLILLQFVGLTSSAEQQITIAAGRIYKDHYNHYYLPKVELKILKYTLSHQFGMTGVILSASGGKTQSLDTIFVGFQNQNNAERFLKLLKEDKEYNYAFERTSIGTEHLPVKTISSAARYADDNLLELTNGSSNDNSLVTIVMAINVTVVEPSGARHRLEEPSLNHQFRVIGSNGVFEYEVIGVYPRVFHELRGLLIITPDAGFYATFETERSYKQALKTLESKPALLNIQSEYLKNWDNTTFSAPARRIIVQQPNQPPDLLDTYSHRILIPPHVEAFGWIHPVSDRVRIMTSDAQISIRFANSAEAMKAENHLSSPGKVLTVHPAVEPAVIDFLIKQRTRTLHFQSEFRQGEISAHLVRIFDGRQSLAAFSCAELLSQTEVELREQSGVRRLK